MKLKIVGIGLFLAFIGFVGGWGASKIQPRSWELLSPKGKQEIPKPYEDFSLLKLATSENHPSKIEVVGDKFYYTSQGKKVSGAINIPTGIPPKGGFPVVVMLRGYVEKEVYTTGTGTKHAAEYYAGRGYVTLAPDFLGYGESDLEDENAIGARLARPVTVLDLLASLNSLEFVNDEAVFLWGHSNGGQIAISVAEILGKRAEDETRIDPYRVLGATLWAPVSKPFPYSILYYTDEALDQGKWLRSQVAEFEKLYDVYDFSIDRYLDWINVPIQIHQGTEDEAVPKRWSDELANKLKEKEKDVSYFVYPGADHNFQPTWSTVVSRDNQFFHSLEK